MIQVLPTPRYMVTDDGDRHIYSILYPDGTKVTDLNNVTGALNIIGGNKVNMLMSWAVKKDCEKYRDLILEFMAAPSVVRPVTLSAPVLEAMLIEAKREHRKKFHDAGDLGQTAHDAMDGWINCKITGREFIYSEYVKEDNKYFKEAQTPLETFISWANKYNLRFISGDLKVAKVLIVGGKGVYKFGGRLDALATDEKDLIIIDFKTSNFVGEEAAAQIAGYREGLEATYGLKAKRGIMLKFSKTDPNVFEFREVDMRGATKLWRDCISMTTNCDMKKVWRMLK